MNLEEMEQDKTVDPSKLDVECVRQAETFYKWAERSARAKAKVDLLKFEVETLLVRLQLKIREDPTEYGLSKVTENAIDARSRTDTKYIAKCEEWLAAKGESMLLDQAVAAMEQKKRMLEVLITLHGQEWFAGPSVPHNLVELWQEARKAREEGVNARQGQAARRRVRQGD